MFGQPWRQAMSAPQNQPYPSGLGFPTRSPQGGWTMPVPPVYQPKPLAQPKPPSFPGVPEGWSFDLDSGTFRPPIGLSMHDGRAFVNWGLPNQPNPSGFMGGFGLGSGMTGGYGEGAHAGLGAALGGILGGADTGWSGYSGLGLGGYNSADVGMGAAAAGISGGLGWGLGGYGLE